MSNFVLVFLGGGLGSLARFAIAKTFQPYQPIFPYATLLANLLSCFLLGILMDLSYRNHLDQPQKFFLMTGFCGGFSTFSTFTGETLALYQNGHLALALFNSLGSLILGLLALLLGLFVGRHF